MVQTDHQMVQTDQQMVLADRLTALRSACRATSEARRPADTLDYLLDHRFLRRKLIYNDKYKLIFCAVPKISSTRWKHLLGTLSGQIPPNKTLDELKMMDVNVHGGRVHHFLSELPASEARRRLETYTSAVFVRHPLERLVSAFREKYKAENWRRPFIFRTAVQILAHEQNRSTEQVAEEGLPPQVTFEQFARWVADAPPFDPDVSYPPDALNIHWLPMHHQCHPCLLPYSLLGKFETMHEDAELLFKMTNITTVSLPKRTKPSSTASITGDFVKSLTPETLRRVIKHFLLDFVLFGYRPESVLSGDDELRDSVAKTFKGLVDEL
ncbi:carbohydrate sulfotransferase 11-like [Amphibalanus amphitrite]|uniref:carbohydrate sulfotransferase 11-like n=1 Tax=Amphibalanus amphitrite TaxID=1232801 RepID=UPI001C90A12C|nr:carbohydrate sulfotransferase 11-like [Amphibalanus amphitrite]